MICHMRTTLLIPDELFRRLKQRAVQARRTLSAVVAEALERGLAEPATPAKLPPLPVYRMGQPRVEVADRDALYRAMEG